MSHTRRGRIMGGVDDDDDDDRNSEKEKQQAAAAPSTCARTSSVMRTGSPRPEKSKYVNLSLGNDMAREALESACQRISGTFMRAGHNFAEWHMCWRTHARRARWTRRLWAPSGVCWCCGLGGCPMQHAPSWTTWCVGRFCCCFRQQ